MLQNITVDAQVVERIIEFRAVTKDPVSGAELADMAQMTVGEIVTEIEGQCFAVVDRRHVVVLHQGHVAVDSSAADQAYGTYRVGFAAPSMQALRAQIETRVNELIDLVHEQFPYITLVKTDGTYEREIPEDVQVQGFQMLQQGATPETRSQVAEVQRDEELIPPHIRQQMHQAQPIHGQTGQPMGAQANPAQAAAAQQQAAAQAAAAQQQAAAQAAGDGPVQPDQPVGAGTPDTANQE